ncbi:marginal zone B- and B1-cell-specific protein-like [Glandiceps talaboti]
MFLLNDRRQRICLHLKMSTLSATIICVVVVSILVDVSCGQGVHEPTGPNSGKLSFKTPDLSDEEAHSQHLPPELKCDACRILAYTMKEKFDAAHKKRPSLKKLPESEVIDMLETVCNAEWENIGLKEIDGVKRLSGPGLDTKDVPGVMQGGGKWPHRINQQCGYFVGEHGEDVIYDNYHENPKKFEKWLCYGADGDCAVKEKKGKKAKKNKTEL